MVYRRRWQHGAVSSDWAAVDRNSIDTLQLAKLFEAENLKENLSSYKLGAVCERMGITLKGAHGAPADVEATKQLFIHLIKKLRDAGNRNPLPARATANAVATGGRARDGFQFEF